MKASKYFVVGKNNISYVWTDFLTHFGEMEVRPKKCSYQFKKLEKSMNDKTILAELKPEEVTLSDFAYILQQRDLLKTGYANIFYIRDSKNILWAVHTDWDDDGWDVSAYSIDDPSGWSAVFRVFGRRFLDSETLKPKTLSSFDPLEFKFSYGGKNYNIVEVE